MKNKKFIVIGAVIIVVLMICISTMQMTADKKVGTTIQDGTLTYSAGHYLEGEPLMPGYDPYGYNYQAHMFSGSYANVYLGRDGYPPYEGDDEAYLQRLYDEEYIEPATKTYDDVELSGGSQEGHFDDLWNLISGDLTISFTYDAYGLVADYGGDAHAWAELGIRTMGYGDFNPTWDVEGAGVWLATDYHWAVDTFDPDPVGSPTLDLDDKLILQKAGGHGEGDYDLPSVPPTPGDNHAVWFDRDGVDQWQAQMWGAIDSVTYNTGGTYDIVITLHADSPTSGTAYMTINGEPQGYYDPNWHPGPADLMPAGMTFTGDMKKMQVFYGIYGYGATHSIEFNNIEVQGHKVDTPFDTWYWPYRNDNIVMKWNDAWLSNMDRDDDSLLDRHYGYSSYIGSGAWETNHQWGSYEVEGVIYNWDYFVKIVAAPSDAYVDGGIWYTVDGIEIGWVIWGEFAVIQEVYNDEGTGEEGIYYKGLGPVGFGYFEP